MRSPGEEQLELIYVALKEGLPSDWRVAWINAVVRPHYSSSVILFMRRPGGAVENEKVEDVGVIGKSLCEYVLAQTMPVPEVKGRVRLVLAMSASGAFEVEWIADHSISQNDFLTSGEVPEVVGSLFAQELP